MWRASLAVARPALVAGTIVLIANQRASAGQLLYGDASCDERVKASTLRSFSKLTRG